MFTEISVIIISGPNKMSQPLLNTYTTSFEAITIPTAVPSNNICVDSPRQREDDECAVTGGDETCVVFFTIYLVFAVVLIFALIAVYFVKRKIQQLNDGEIRLTTTTEESIVAQDIHLMRSESLGVDSADEAKRPGLSNLCGNPRRSFYNPIMVLIVACVVSRVLYLAIVFVKDDHRFEYNLFTDNLVTMCKLLTVIQFCKFKLHFYYFAKGKTARPWVRIALLLVEVAAIGVCVNATAAICSGLEES